jgi:hypothetical protein
MTTTQVSRRDRIVLALAVFGAAAVLALLGGADAWFIDGAFSWWQQNGKGVKFAVKSAATVANSLIKIVDGLTLIYTELG